MLNVEIRIKGRIDEHWSSWFAGLAIAHTAQEETVLSGTITDQAELYGLVAKLRDLGLSLLSVNSTEVEGREPSESQDDDESSNVPS